MDAEEKLHKARSIDNLEIWDDLCVTDPDFTKKFDKGTYKGTSISPVYIFKSLTDKFGPVGLGWKVEVLDRGPVFLQDGQVLALIDVDLFYKHNDEWSAPIRGTGGDFIVRQTKNGIKVDDDGRKKALTDAITNATRLLGQSADIHMGLYDDPDYKIDLAEKFENKDLNWKEVSIDLINELNDCLNDGSLIIFQEKNENLIESMPDSFGDTVRQMIEVRARDIKSGTPKKWGYGFKGTKDAYEWFKIAASELVSISTIEQLDKYETDNFHIIDSLSMLKAKKYAHKETGKLPKERLEERIKAMRQEFKQKEKS